MSVQITTANRLDDDHRVTTPVTAVSWGAIIAGAVAAVVISLILIALGAGFGLSSVSPWFHSNQSTDAFPLAAALWLVVVQWLSAALGGYLTGRLRIRWIGLHTHEVAFRDTVHGFLAWATATVVGAALLGSAVSGLLGGATQATATLASGAAQTTAASYREIQDYATDSLFRPSTPGPNDSLTPDTRAQVTRIFLRGSATGAISAPDHDYLVNLVAARTGLSANDAEKRVNQVIADEKNSAAKIRDLADKARKAAALGTIFLAVSMLIGAFIGSTAAALGGLRRDQHP